MKKFTKHYFVLFLMMGCIGITVEIFFTAIYDYVISSNKSLILKGYSYVWMFPIYGLSALTFPPFSKILSPFSWWIRGLIFTVGILLVEYLTGKLLCILTGSCPWEYKTGMHIQGLIRLDYFPLWFVFAIVTEKVIRWLHPRVSFLRK